MFIKTSPKHIHNLATGVTYSLRDNNASQSQHVFADDMRISNIDTTARVWARLEALVAEDLTQEEEAE